MEEWRVVPSWPEYEVSDMGRVRPVKAYHRSRAGLVLKQTPIPSGYPSVTLSRPSQRTCALPHALVAEAFLGPRPAGHQVNHKDGDKLNNVLANLEYVTPSENARHAFRTGLNGGRFNPDHPLAKLKPEDIRSIRATYQAGGISQGAIARAYGVSATIIRGIVKGRTWRNVA